MIEINNRMASSTITLINFKYSNILCMHVVITSLLNTEAKHNSCYIFKMKRIVNYFHTNKKQKEDGGSVAPGRSTVDFVIEKVLPDCPEKHFILDEATIAEKRGKYSETIPASIKIESCTYAHTNGNTAAAEHFNRKYLAKKYVFNRKTIESWMKKYKPTSAVKELHTPFSAHAGRPNMVPDNILLKIKDIVNSCRLAGCVINRSCVIVWKRFYTNHDASLLKECGGPIELTNRWTRRLMEKMNWSQCKATASKLPVAPALGCEIKHSFQKRFATAVDTYKIKKDLIFNFDQTLLAFISPGSYTMAPKGEKKVPIQNENSKGGITGTIVINATGVTLPF